MRCGGLACCLFVGRMAPRHAAANRPNDSVMASVVASYGSAFDAALGAGGIEFRFADIFFSFCLFRL
jgi:hypothetical protein